MVFAILMKIVTMVITTMTSLVVLAEATAPSHSVVTQLLTTPLERNVMTEPAMVLLPDAFLTVNLLADLDFQLMETSENAIWE